MSKCLKKKKKKKLRPASKNPGHFVLPPFLKQVLQATTKNTTKKNRLEAALKTIDIMWLESRPILSKRPKWKRSYNVLSKL